VRLTKDGNAVLASTLDSAIRLLDRANGTLLQAYKGHANTDFRVRSCLGFNDAFVLSGSEDGAIYAWDLLEGRVVHRLAAHAGKVASAVVVNDARKEWLSAGVDGNWEIFLCCFSHSRLPSPPFFSMLFIFCKFYLFYTLIKMDKAQIFAESQKFFFLLSLSLFTFATSFYCLIYVYVCLVFIICLC
jgi:hypothetical protein